MSNTHNLYVLKEGRKTPETIIELESYDVKKSFNKLLRESGISLDFSNIDEIRISKYHLKQFLKILENDFSNSWEFEYYYDLKNYIDNDEYEVYYVIE